MIITNSFSINMLSNLNSTVKFTEIDRAIAAYYLKDNCTSAVGHKDTAAVLSSDIGVEIVPNRIDVKLDPGTFFIVGQYIGPRLDEGCTTLPDGANIKWILAHVLD